jgi:hypothetical protein
LPDRDLACLANESPETVRAPQRSAQPDEGVSVRAFWPVDAANDRGGSRPELACPCPVVKVGPRRPPSQETCVEPRERLRQSPCGWRRSAVPDGGLKPSENRPVSTTLSSPGRAEDATTAWHEMAPKWFLRNVRHVGDRPRVRSGRYRETVRSETAMPSFSNSPWRRGAPQRRFPSSCVE